MAWRPGRSVELVAGTPAGGGQDRPARALIKALASQRLVDVPVQLVNIPGRGGSNGWDRLASAPGDPHLIAVSSPPLVTNKLLGVASIDHADLTPLAVLYTEYIAFVVRADSPLRGPADLIERLRDPASLGVALATAVGNSNHIALAQCTQHAGGDARALELRVFDSALYAVADVIAGRSELGAITAVSAVKELRAGRLRALALSSPQRLPREFAQTPTWREAGVDCIVGTWRGVTGTAQLTAAQVAYWDRVLRAAADSPEWNAEREQNYWANTYMDSAETRAFLEAEQQALRGALAGLGLMATR